MSAVSLAGHAIHWLDRIPYALLALPLRLAVATVFWNSAQSHLANWDTTLYMFETDYSLPFLPPVSAAYMAVAIEVVAPILLSLGLFTRAAALVLLGMTTVIESSSIRKPGRPIFNGQRCSL
jgi:putative oxidoreductase